MMLFNHVEKRYSRVRSDFSWHSLMLRKHSCTCSIANTSQVLPSFVGSLSIASHDVRVFHSFLEWHHGSSALMIFFSYKRMINNKRVWVWSRFGSDEFLWYYLSQAPLSGYDAKGADGGEHRHGCLGDATLRPREGNSSPFPSRYNIKNAEI